MKYCSNMLRTLILRTQSVSQQLVRKNLTKPCELSSIAQMYNDQLEINKNLKKELKKTNMSLEELRDDKFFMYFTAFIIGAYIMFNK